MRFNLIFLYCGLWMEIEKSLAFNLDCMTEIYSDALGGAETYTPHTPLPPPPLPTPLFPPLLCVHGNTAPLWNPRHSRYILKYAARLISAEAKSSDRRRYMYISVSYQGYTWTVAKFYNRVELSVPGKCPPSCLISHGAYHWHSLGAHYSRIKGCISFVSPIFFIVPITLVLVWSSLNGISLAVLFLERLIHWEKTPLH